MSSTVRQVVFPPPREPDRGPDGGRVLYQLHPGGDFILDSPANPVPLWGRGDEVLLADGEALIIAGPNGVGKTSLAQQLVLGRAGFPEYQDLLGYPIAPVSAPCCIWRWIDPGKLLDRFVGWWARRGATN